VSTPGTPDALTVVWREQNRWSQAADQQKRRIERARAAALVLAVSGAVLGTAAAQLARPSPVTGRILAFLSAFAIALAALAQRGASGKAVQDWTRLRSISEALKAEMYSYLAGVGRYRGADGLRRLLDRVERLESDAGVVNAHLAGVQPVERDLPAVHDVDSYLAVRVRGQIADYYRPKEASVARRAGWFRRLQWVLGVTGAGLAALAGTLSTQAIAPWIGVLTTISAAVAAHAAAGRFEFQQLEYARTANELERLIARRGGTGGDEELVERAEQIISVQNDGWMVRWVTDQVEAA
jgi:SMODS and SLOG-associating 2TM effector domain 1/Protein of unknown function (DUF4231)